MHTPMSTPPREPTDAPEPRTVDESREPDRGVDLPSEPSPDALDEASVGGAADGAPSAAPEPRPADPRVAALADDLRRRLRPVCRDWDDADFEAVIERIAGIKARWTDGEWH